MGFVYADIELINAEDVTMAKRYHIGTEEIRRMPVKMLVDSGAAMLAINETILEQLGFPFKEKRIFQMANGHVQEFDRVTQVELRFKNRSVLCSAIVLPGDAEPLLGNIPMEEMDVLIHPLREELIVNPDHPFRVQLKLK